MPRAVIVAYGNPLRSDDGLAWIAAELLQAKFPIDDVETLCLQQLGPELADNISRCECVVFIDAASAPGEPGEIHIQELSRETAEPVRLSSFCHAVSPEAILLLAAQLYGARPKAFLATIVGQTFQPGESLSLVVRHAIPVLVSRIGNLIEGILGKEQ